MSKFEKLGSYLLFEKIDEDKLSKNFIAGQFSGNQVQSICIVKKFDHSLSTLPDFILDVNQEAEILKQLANPNIVRPSAFVQEKSEFGAIFEYVEGKSLRAVLNKCAQDGFPFTVDHSLLVASRLCTALEYLHSKKVNDQRLIHGYICPEVIQVTYDGEIRVQFLGLSRTLMKFAAGKDKFLHDYKNYLAPEVLSQGKLDKGSDIFGAGVVLYEMLHGEALYAKGRNVNPADAIESAQMNTQSGDRVALPEELKKLLHQALATDPAQRFGSVADMRKALDLLLFSSEFSPTTFNLAFFMHSLFRETIDEENKNIAAYRKTDVAQHVKEEPPPPPKPEHPVGAAAAKDVPLPATPAPSLGQPEIFGAAETAEKSKMPLIIGILIALAAIGGIGYFAFKPGAPATQTTQQQPAPQPGTSALTPEQLKAQEAEKLRLQEEASKAQDEAKKKDEELKALQAKLDQLLKLQEQATKQQQQPASGSTPAPAAPAVDTAAIKKLQEEAKRLEEEKKKQEDLADQKRKEAEQAAAQQAAAQQAAAQQAQAQPPAGQPPATDQGTTPAAAPSTPAPQPSGESAQPSAPAAAEVKEGQEVELTPDVVKPEILSRVNPTYPPIAQQKKIEGTVILSVLISEKGEAIDARVLRGAGGQSGLNEAAIESVKRWKFRPAVKDGKRVRVWMTYPIVFKLQ